MSTLSLLFEGLKSMNLLYCLNGLVVTVHDDQQAYVAPSNYGSGVRIIPWSQPLGNLTYSAPFDPSKPPPPYNQPTETPAILKNYASQMRYIAVVAGITFNAASGPVPVATDRMSQMLVGNLAQYAATLAGTTLVDFIQNSVHYSLTAAECITMNTSVSNFVQQIRAIEASCIADQNLGTPTMTTYAQIDAKFGAPTLTSISPTTYAHGTATVITATGTAFTSTSKILIGGTVETTTFVSATQLTATAPASLVAGTYNVTVKNANGFSSGAQVLTLT
jgi:hypothetical protein